MNTEQFKEVHEARLKGVTFTAICSELFDKYEITLERRGLNRLYLQWCSKNHIKPVYDASQAYRANAKRKGGVLPYADMVKRDCMLHLLDLVRAHGEIVTNRLTGEVISGGYPNVDIPDIGTPKLITPQVYGSLIGSASLSCVEFGK